MVKSTRKLSSIEDQGQTDSTNSWPMVMTNTRRMLPRLCQDPLCSTRLLRTSWSGFDSSCWLRLRFRRENRHHRRTSLCAEMALTRPDTVYRSVLQMSFRRTDVRPMSGCSRRHLNAVE